MIGLLTYYGHLPNKVVLVMLTILSGVRRREYRSQHPTVQLDGTI